MPYDRHLEKILKEMSLDSVIVQGGCRKCIQASDVCLNKPFKARVAELHNQWHRECVHQFTDGENVKPPFRKIIIEWVLDPWSQLSKKTINLLKCCDFDLANDGTDDDFIHCLKKEQPCEGVGKKLSSQL